MHRDVTLASIGNGLAWLVGGINWGIVASIATAFYFGSLGVLIWWDRWHGKKGKAEEAEK